MEISTNSAAGPDPSKGAVFVITRPCATAASVRITFRGPGDERFELEFPFSASIAQIKAALLTRRRLGLSQSTKIGQSCQQNNDDATRRSRRRDPFGPGAGVNSSGVRDIRSITSLASPPSAPCTPTTGPIAGRGCRRRLGADGVAITDECKLIFKGKVISEEFLLGDYLLICSGFRLGPKCKAPSSILILWRQECIDCTREEQPHRKQHQLLLPVPPPGTHVAMTPARQDVAAIESRAMMGATSTVNNHLRHYQLQRQPAAIGTLISRRSVQRRARSVDKFSGLRRGVRCGLGIRALIAVRVVVDGRSGGSSVGEVRQTPRRRR